MDINLTFESVCKSITDEHPDMIDNINVFSDLALAFGVFGAAGPIAAVAVAGTATVPPAMIALTAVGTLANLFAVKDKIFQTVECIVDKITNKKDNNPLELMNRMERAYYLICYTSFFEALSYNERLTQLLKKVKMKPNEKTSILAEAMKELQITTMTVVDDTIEDIKGNPFRIRINLPRPGDTLQVEREKLGPLYEQLAVGIEYFFTSLALWEDLNEKEKAKIKSALKELPDKALQYFEMQFFLLAQKCPSFAKWLNYIDSDKTKTQLSSIERKLAALAQNCPQTSDIGLQHLSTMLESTYKKMALQSVDKALQALENKYESTLQSPILDPKDMPVEEGKISLSYPKRSEIFVPQAFKLIHYVGQKQLELPSIWSNVPERNDLGDFLLSYFLNPFSERSPLIILGQPGSGKSLLTSMLAARLLVSSFTPIRIELRNINAEADIKTQITEQIAQITGRNIDWGMLSDHFEQRSGLVLFDGYDELLQASGKVFSAYLRDIEQFQIEQIAMKRPPVRAIVTSRINLIDKAEIPPDATIIRLLEFDEVKQKCWIDVWNNANMSYFQQTKVKPFAIPENTKDIKELAGQPLLLLMLALYDSASNQLHKTRGLNQTLLYDNLLRQFIERELKKDSNMFKNMDKKERVDAIEQRMEYFGIAAIGMFNRRALHIDVKQLESDLSFFEFKETIPMGKGRNLSQAEKLFGSFFFVKLEAQHKFTGRKYISEMQEHDNESDVAYEFLHNTFGEFLTTDFILRKILNKTYSIYKMSSDRYQQPILRQTMDNPNSELPGADWYACLMCTPLFSRPVIINMMQQWLKNCLQQRKKEGTDRRDIKEFLKNLDVIIESFLEFAFKKDQLPDIMIGKKLHSFDRLSTLGYVAIYTLNLILLRTMFDLDGYTFKEIDEITQQERFPSQDGTFAWDRLTHLWRSWFSLETLFSLAAIFLAKREDKIVHLKMRERTFNVDRLGLIHVVSQALADNATAGISGLLLHDSFREDETSLDDIRQELESENINLNLELATKKIRALKRDKIFPIHELSFLNQNIRNSILNLETIALFLNETNKLIQELTNVTGNYIKKDDFLEHLYGVDVLLIDEIKIAKITNSVSLVPLMRFVIDEYINTLKRGASIERIEVFAEILTSLIQIFRESGSRFQNHYSELIHLLNLFLLTYHGRIPTNLAVEMIRLAKKDGNYEILDYFSQNCQGFLEEVVNPEKSVSIDLAFELIKLIRENGDRNALDYFERYLIRMLKERHEVPVALVIQVIKFAFEVSDQKNRNIFLEEYVPMMIDAENIPLEVFIELLKYTTVNDSQIILLVLRTYSRVITSSTRYVSDELASAMIKFACKDSDKDILDYFCGDYFKNLLQAQRLVPVELAVGLVKLALTQENPSYNQADIESFYHNNISVESCYLDLLPVDTFVDLKWLAQKFHDEEMLRKIEQRLEV